uniref:tRNA-splicing endonuclease subunit Sen2 n=1 Tax=Leptobrachium leishanense TaxID=445787 RepID=A0A8C5WJV9_9ANUR
MEGIFHAPRRKRTVYESYESPFPIPLSHDSCDREFKIYQAEIINNCVIVTNPEDIERLYSQGYFGKGILSRSRPQYSVAEQELQINLRGSKPQFPIISSKKYQCHLEWAKELLKGQGLDLDSVTKLLDDYTSPLNLPEEDPPAASETPLEGDNGEESPSLEGNPMYDPLAKYISTEPDAKDAVEEWDKQSLEKMHCHKHDDLIAQCGCKPKRRRGPNQPIPRALEDDKHEYVLVQEEEQSSEACEDHAKGETKKQLVCRRNPFKIFEYLQLSREEAFFLCYTLGCLTVRYEKEPLTILKLWEIFGASQPNFPTTYMAYHHFRSKGWVPKIGLKYGTDLLLYRKGPPFYHASYSVIVEIVDENFEGRPLRPLTWKSLAGLNRTTVNVSKELLFCFLIKSHGFTEKDLASPGCMKKIKVQELILNRWIASRERMDQDEL